MFEVGPSLESTIKDQTATLKPCFFFLQPTVLNRVIVIRVRVREFEYKSESENVF